jgi:fatty-acyl-CoA synthase
MGSVFLRVVLAARAVRWLLPLTRFGPAARRSAADVIERRAAKHPERVFVRFEGRELSYGAWNAAANRIAHWALARGVGPGDVVGLLMESRPEFLVTWAGLAKAGATTALLNTNLEGEPLSHALASAGCRTLLVGEECAARVATLDATVRAGLAVLLVGDTGREGVAAPLPDAKRLDEEAAGYSAKNPDRRVREGVRAGDPLFLIYTSGTTGLPKAARMSHARFLGGGTFALLAGFGRRDVLYCALPLYHTAGGVMSVGAVLRAGATLALRRRFSASRFFDDAVESGATAFQYIGELCRYLLNQPRHPLERSHRIRLCVGNGLRPELWREFQRRFGIPQVVEFYGATEANVALVNLENRTGSVGKPLPGQRAELVRFDFERGAPARGADGRCIRCATGEVGELLGRIAEGRTAAGRFEGYTSREASEAKVLRDVFAPGDAWFRSGDLLRRDAEGFYWFVDRVGDTFRWKGENVATEEVAGQLGRFPGALLCAVYGVPVPGADGRAGMAALSLAEPSAFDGEALFAHAEGSLPPYARPAFVRLRGDPALTATLKLRKVELQRDGFDPATVTDPLFYRDDERRAYLPLTREAHARIESGGVRL